MIRNGWQTPWIRTLTTMLTVGIMVMIFCLSMENAEQSNLRSGYIAETLARILHYEYDEMDPEQKQTSYDEAQMIVRKLAHYTEYMILGFAIRLCTESWFGQRTTKTQALPAISAVGGTVYAATDEIHQLSIDGRYGSWTDVMIDTAGVCSGAWLGSALIKIINASKEKHNQGDHHDLFQKSKTVSGRTIHG